MRATITIRKFIHTKLSLIRLKLMPNKLSITVYIRRKQIN